MKNIFEYSQQEILNLTDSDIFIVFDCQNESEITKIYKKLSQKWHPDKNIGSNTNDAFIKIKELYHLAIKKIKSGTWQLQNKLIINLKNSQLEINYKKEYAFDLGNIYTGKNHVTYLINPTNNDLLLNSIKNISNIKFNDIKLSKEAAKYIPKIHKKIIEKNVIIFENNQKLLRLRDVLTHFNGFIDPKHVAWILSTMYNNACLTQTQNIMYGGFSLDNYFIDPEQHIGSMFGWWYSQTLGNKLIALEQTSFNFLPFNLLNPGIASTQIDLEMIRLVGRQLLGDPSGMNLHKNTNIPKALANWLKSSSLKDAISEYTIWHEVVLKESFGVRRYIKMNLNHNDIY